MKKLKLLRNLNSKGRYLALLLTVTAGLLYCSSAWANVDFWSQNAANVHIKGWEDPVYGKGDKGLSGSEEPIKTIEGHYSSLVFTDIWVKVWHDNGSDWMQGGVKFRYWIDDKDEKNIDLTGGSWSDWSDSKQNQTWYKNSEVTIYDGSKAGNHKLTFLFYGKPNFDADRWLSNNSQNYEIDFTVPGWSTTSGNATIGAVKVGSSVTESNISLGTHYGSSDDVTTTISGTDKDDFEVISVDADKITVKFTPSAVGERTATITITDKYGKTRTLTVTGTGNNTPTVLIAGKESVDAPNVTLNGYIKYTGCETVTEYGFVYGTSSEVTISATKVVASPDPIGTVVAGTDFTKTFEVAESDTYYYKAYMITSGGNYLSAETRQFTVDIACDITTTVNATFEDGSTTASATFTGGSASIGVMSTNHSQYFQWVVVEKPADASLDADPVNKRISTITVDKVGQYKIKLQGKCNEADEWKDSEILTLNVCAPAEFTQLYLDKHINNVLCEDEEATATCITKEGFTYHLYNPAGNPVGDPLAGTGATQTWRHVTGEGEFTMRTSPTGMDYCVAIVSSATQSYNTPTLEITADTDLDDVTNYQPVILSKKNVTSDTYVDTNPTWEIIAGSDKGYLLNEHNRLAYDSRAREKVVFKGGATTASQITVKASAYKTVAVEDEGGNYTKQCPTTVEVKLTVSPAVDDCPQN